jgi:IS30 family transposase
MASITKCRGGSPLTIRERVIIETRWEKDGRSITAIAEELQRHKSTISREIGGKPRHGVGKYHAEVAHRKAIRSIGGRGNVPKPRRHTPLLAYIEEHLRIGWSPEQIAIRLPHVFPDDPRMRISHEAIYGEVYRRVHRGGNGRVKDGMTDLRPLLARRHTRRATKGFRKAQREERETTLPSIEERPVVVARRNRIGDWEDDTIVSRQSLARVKSITERKSGLVFFGKTTDGTARDCDRVLRERLGRVPRQWRKTLTRDRGSENRGWEALARDLGIDIYFAHPYASYERGTNENTNGLFRRYYPKKTDLRLLSDEEIARVEYLINTRPRKRLGGLTPVEVFYQHTGVAIYS